jgi:hypothetical protein
MTHLYRDRTDRRLRRKDDTSADDPDTYTNQWDPGTFIGTVGSIAAGSLTVTITPIDARHPTPAPITVTITTETDAQAAAAVVAEVADRLSSVDANADFDPYLRHYLSRAEYTAATAVARFVPNPNGHKFTVVLSAVGGATFTLSPDDVFPITAWSAKQVGSSESTPGEAVLSVYAVTTADEVLAIGTCTFDVQILRATERYDAVTSTELRPGVADLGTLTGLTLGEEFRVPMGGGRFGVRITNIANAPGSTDALDVRYREAVT